MLWVPPTSPVFYLIRADYICCTLFRDYLKKITVSEFDREEKPIVFNNKHHIKINGDADDELAEEDQPVCLSSDNKTLYYVYTRKGRYIEFF